PRRRDRRQRDRRSRPGGGADPGGASFPHAGRVRSVQGPGAAARGDGGAGGRLPAMRRTRSPSVGIQGERGAFSELAVLSLFGARARIVPCAEFEGLFRAAEKGRCRFALAPVENTIAGSIHQVHDLLLDSPLKVSGEAIIRVSHTLVALPGVGFRDVRRVYSHPVALAQCERFFRRNPRLAQVATYDTAGSVRLL